MEETKKLRRRLFALCGLFAACLTVFFTVMFDAQIVHGEEYRAAAVRTNTRVEAVEAMRGVITDRNGKLLVSNRAVYTLTVDPSLVDADALNGELLRLLELLRARGVTWFDELPLTAEAPYEYDDSVNRSGMLAKYFDAKKWVAEGTDTEGLHAQMTPQEVFDRLCAEFGLNDVPDGQRRDLAGLRYSLATAKMDGDGTFLLASGIDVALISLLTDGDYGGVRVGIAVVREYRTDAAAHILGHVGKIQNWDDYKDKGGYKWNDLVGIDGVEQAFEDELRGTDGIRVVTTNADGKVVSEIYSVEPEPGGNVALTIDVDFQERVEQILANAVSGMTDADGVSRGAAAAVVQVGTGEVLSLASYPTFSRKTFNQDFETLRNDPLRPMYNRATMGTYAPGSTFKPAVAVAALESGVITPQTRITDLGAYHYYDMVYNCWIYSSAGGTHGSINVTDAITVSCNYFFYEVGRQLGIAAIDRYAAAFGLGEPTGIEIPESVGTMTSPDYVNSLKNGRWTDGLTLQAAIGQAYDLFTPLQIANYIATLANGGTRCKAHLLKEVSAFDGVSSAYVYDEPPVESVEIGAENLRAVFSGMRKLVTDGSVQRAFRSCVVDAAAKTGTAQTGGRGTRSNGVFVAFAPYDDPQIALALVIEKGGSGGALADAAVEILNAYFSAAAPDSVGENKLLK